MSLASKHTVHSGLEIRVVDGRPAVLPQSLPPTPRADECLVRVLAASKCGADAKALSGDKEVPALEGRRLGHEAVGVVLETGSHVRCARRGDIAAVLPHAFPRGHDAECGAARVGADEVCVGFHHTDHFGWDVDGTFATWLVVAEEQLAVVRGDVLDAVNTAAPDLPRGGLAVLVEPMLCVLTGVERLRLARGMPGVAGADVLVLGAGHIGRLWVEALLDAGASVRVHDALPEREGMAQRIGQVASGLDDTAAFDVVVDTTGRKQALDTAFDVVAPGGLVYCFAGLARHERGAVDPNEAVVLEAVHRHALQVVVRQADGRSLTVMGHSGYRRSMIPAALGLLARRASRISEVITGIVDGFDSDVIHARDGSGTSVAGPDAAVVAVLEDDVDLRRHVSVVLCPVASAVRLPALGCLA